MLILISQFKNAFDKGFCDHLCLIDTTFPSFFIFVMNEPIWTRLLEWSVHKSGCLGQTLNHWLSPSTSNMNAFLTNAWMSNVDLFWEEKEEKKVDFPNLNINVFSEGFPMSCDSIRWNWFIFKWKSFKSLSLHCLFFPEPTIMWDDNYDMMEKMSECFKAT